MPRRFWSAEEEQRLREAYPDTPMPAMMAAFSRTDRQIYAKAAALGLKRSEAYLASPHACRLRKGDQVGRKTQFKQGHQTWNKGISYNAGGRSAETQFQSGHKPHTWRPIGTERVTQDGYLERKVTDTGCTRNDYQAVHRLIWIERHGDIPPGHVVVFKDTLPKHKNITVERLELISRAELARRNTIHRYPPELKAAIRLVKKLERKIKDRNDEELND